MVVISVNLTVFSQNNIIDSYIPYSKNGVATYNNIQVTESPITDVNIDGALSSTSYTPRNITSC